MKRTLTFLFIFLFSFRFLSAQVVINEYMCSNVSSFPDNFGSYEDWIELYNTTASPVNLTGWYLSNNKTKPTKWQLGNVTINANGFLRIWASGRGINSGANLHASFTLTQCMPQAIILADASANIIDSLTLKRNQVGHSQGRTTNGAGTWSVFLNPTPNASNNTGTPYQEYATTPQMNLAPGFYALAQSVALSSPDPNITIRYTTNGTTPTTASTAYSSPISISATTVLRAKAFSSTATIPASFVANATYFINVTHTKAVVSVFGDQTAQLLGGNQNLKPETGFQYFDSLGNFKAESYGITNKHGNDSWSYPQRGIDFVSQDEYGYNYTIKNKLFNVKSRTEFQRIILKAAANDNYPFECPKAGNPYAWGDPTLFDGAHIRDAFVQTAAQKGNLYLDERTWTPCTMYLNGLYWGVYDLREKVEDAEFTNYYYNTPSDSLQFLAYWGGIKASYGGNQAITDWNNLVTFTTSNSMAVQSNYNYVDSLLSIKSFVDYIALNSYCVTSDWLNWNTAWWRGINANAKHKKWRYTLWDLDATFHHYINYTGIPNNNANAGPCDPQTINPSPPDYGQIAMLNALMQNPGFKSYYILRYYDLVNTSLSCQRMVGILDSMINEIKPEMPGQIAKWGGSMAAWQQNVSDLRNFILARCDSVIHQFTGCYGTTGPFPIKVNVSPPLSGTVDVNTLHLTNFIWSGNYPGNIQMGFVAHPDSSYCFDHWEFQHHTPSPSITDSAVTVNLTQSDSIIAHFTKGVSTPTVTATKPTVCVGDTSLLSLNGGTTFTWTPASGLSCTTCPNPVATPTSTITYSVTVNGSCTAGSGTITVNVTQPGPPSVTAVNPSICVGSSTTLNVNGGTNFTWSPATNLSCINCSNPVASPSATTTYSVAASGGKCINGTNSITLTVNPPPVASAGNDQTICNTGAAELSASGGTNFIWSPSTGLNCTNCPNPTATPNSTMTYYVTVLDVNNCKAIDSIVVFVAGECPQIFVPTGFSPNGDNNNDMFYVFGEMKEMHLVIYNRWGQVVFESSDKTIGWDGKFNGELVQSGVYAYKFSATDSRGTKVDKSGNITVVR